MALPNFSELTKDINEDYESQQKNYLVGFLGAIIGAILFTIPWILVQYFINVIASVLAYIIGIGAFKGYTLMKGKIGPLTRWIIALCTLIAVVAAEFAIIGIYFVKYELPLDFEIISLLLDQPDFVNGLLKDIGIGLVMAMLGIAPLFKSLKAVKTGGEPAVEGETNI